MSGRKNADVDPLVAAYRRQGDTLLETWAAGCEGRRGELRRGYATYILINRARLLRARMQGTDSPEKRQRVRRAALLGGER